ncbi:hypothetical protein SAMN05216410_0417 [Sanguibacter gelidistatuariae]|uniref:DUF6286 domain-containing protein n=1 Tax=Sanguibacter gelidistatuariae TaxID=1814289 RepID=A0A1G6GRY6_9MICO|nr:DUF6286 domain-containing protein [Sanguibacter gelidistatuariae]SDB84767.1 hypothetical protein SAMN05216410_0417 [Sanguibacter gelidistatuariae]
MTLVRRVLSVLLALVLLLGGLLGAIEIVLALLGRDPWLLPRERTTWFREQTWETATIRAILIVAVLVGLGLLVLALKRGRPAAFTLASRADGPVAVTVTASRRGIEHALAQVAREADGVTSAQATVSRRRATVHATSRTRAPDDLRAGIETAVADRLTDLGLVDTLATKVRVTSREKR